MAVLSLALGSGAGVRAETEPPPAMLVAPGDELLIDVPTHPELGGVRVVDVRGFLLQEPLAPCRIGGLTTAVAADTLAAAMERFYRGVAGVQVRILRRQLAVRVDGKVAEPGDYFLPYFGGLEEALRAAGGITEGGLLTRVMVQREGQTIEVDLRRFRINGDPSLLPALQTGDRVFVPVSNRDAPIKAALAPLALPFEDPNVVHVMGAVPRGGTHQMPGELTLFEALALGGGPGIGANLKKVRVVPAEGQAYVINLLDLADKQIPEPPLITAGTTILVPEDKPGFLKQTLTIAAPLVLSAYLIKDF